MSVQSQARVTHPRVLAAAAVLLSLAAGATDVLSFAALGRVFTSVMTGNLVLLGLAVSNGSVSKAISASLALSGYAVGAGAGARLARRPGTPKDEVWPRGVTRVLGIELVALLAVLTGWLVSGTRPGVWGRLLLLAAAAVAMGLQSAGTRAVAVPGLSTTHFTSTLTGAIEQVVRPDRSLNWRHATQLAATFAGAGLGAGLLLLARPWAPTLPCALVALVVAMVLLRRPE